MRSPDSKPTPSSQSLATLSGQENDGRLSDAYAEVRALEVILASAVEMIEKRDRQLDESARKLFETRSKNAELKMATMNGEVARRKDEVELLARLCAAEERAATATKSMEFASESAEVLQAALEATKAEVAARAEAEAKLQAALEATKAKVAEVAELRAFPEALTVAKDNQEAEAEGREAEEAKAEVAEWRARIVDFKQLTENEPNYDSGDDGDDATVDKLSTPDNMNAKASSPRNEKYSCVPTDLKMAAKAMARAVETEAAKGAPSTRASSEFGEAAVGRVGRRVRGQLMAGHVESFDRASGTYLIKYEDGRGVKMSKKELDVWLPKKFTGASLKSDRVKSSNPEPWACQVTIDGNSKNVSYHATQLEAVKAYDEYLVARSLTGMRKLNFRQA